MCVCAHVRCINYCLCVRCMLLACVYITIYFMYVQISINMVPCQSITAGWSLGVCEHTSITVYCCCCRSRWALPCSCGPSTGPRCWRRRAAEASSRWCGPDLWPPQNCWSGAAGRSLGWLQRHTDTNPHKETWQTHPRRLAAEVTGMEPQTVHSDASLLSTFLWPQFGCVTVWIWQGSIIDKIHQHGSRSKRQSVFNCCLNKSGGTRSRAQISNLERPGETSYQSQQQPSKARLQVSVEFGGCRLLLTIVAILKLPVENSANTDLGPGTLIPSGCCMLPVKGQITARSDCEGIGVMAARTAVAFIHILCNFYYFLFSLSICYTLYCFPSPRNE